MYKAMSKSYVPLDVVELIDQGCRRSDSMAEDSGEFEKLLLYGALVSDLIMLQRNWSRVSN